MNITDEKDFESSIEQSLIDHGGYVKGDPAAFDRVLALDPTILFKFIKDTQKNMWDSLAWYRVVQTAFGGRVWGTELKWFT